ncbi:VWA domain-containing protein [Seonamhaeicola marinus]|uniref:VWA domain-containing protein n=1 Tax=Seonamhaeicola marinus TaxID=1912246 RepID=A0A5D0HR95_9FLAO|nr:VWA domain-containing protein [Seonamhaeicola marinus]TYA71902.1 VWA domain-containing protein [Seonamhaeicola marinus]
METTTLLYIILSGIIALGIALFQYKYRAKSKSIRLVSVFAFLRFISVFGILLLLVNPKFDKIKYYTEKPELILAVDNTNSIKHLGQDAQAKDLVTALTTNSALNSKFQVTSYVFGNAISAMDSLTFDLKETNINKALSQISEIHTSIAPTVIITDGNQTFGTDYQFAANDLKQPIYPVILGDTVVHTDLKIQQLNANKYAYLKNRFPVEVILVYTGNSNVNSELKVYKGNALVYTEKVAFSKASNSKIVNFTLPASRIGTNVYRASLTALQTEKNKINNTKNFAIEVIDQKTKIAIVSDIVHPDIGALKKSIETNEQRSVSVLNTSEAIAKIDDFQLFILNQPNIKFKGLFEKLQELKKNYLQIIGTKTDLNFVNGISSNFTHENLQQTEEYQADFNLNYSPFQIENIDFESFPPLNANYGSITFNSGFQNILTKRIGSVSTQEPLLSTLEINNRREAVLFGENIWKWRAQSFLNTKSFNEFDNFIGKLIQYLATAKQRSRLNVDYESFYVGNSNVIVNAQIFDKNYVFDNRENLTITLTNTLTKESLELPLVLKTNNFQADLSNLKAGEYNFTVKANSANISKSGSFTILEYNVEEQFLNANVTKLQQLATNSGGNSYFIDNTSRLVNDLINDERFVSVQKSNKNIIPLIDWKILLAIIALSLSVEWFLRKYNGLI